MSAIKDITKMAQPIDYTALATNYDFDFDKDGKLMPTDIDGYYQIREQNGLKLNFPMGHLFIEMKCSNRGVEERGLPVGQKAVFKPLADLCYQGGHLAAYIIAYHTDYDPHTPIDAAAAIVKEAYIPGIMNDFTKCERGRSLKEFVDFFYKLLGAKAGDGSEQMYINKIKGIKSPIKSPIKEKIVKKEEPFDMDAFIAETLPSTIQMLDQVEQRGHI